MRKIFGTPGSRSVLLTASVGILAPVAVVAMLMFMLGETREFFSTFSLADLLSASWSPVVDSFGLIPLVIATTVSALIASIPVLVLGTSAAVRLAFFAGRAEQLLCETALTVMAGLPSVIVGLGALALLVPHLGFTLAAGCVALFVMTFPVFTLLLTGALRQEGDRLWAPSQALGYTHRQFAWRIALRAVLPTLVSGLALSVGKAMGEATAVSIVIGNVSSGVLPDLFGPANTLTTAVLKDHAAATGERRSALYVAAITLGVMIIASNMIGASLARMIRHQVT